MNIQQNDTLWHMKIEQKRTIRSLFYNTVLYCRMKLYKRPDGPRFSFFKRTKGGTLKDQRHRYISPQISDPAINLEVLRVTTIPRDRISYNFFLIPNKSLFGKLNYVCRRGQERYRDAIEEGINPPAAILESRVPPNPADLPVP